MNSTLAAAAGVEAIHSEAARRRTFAIVSHPDAGKTTATEKLLLYAGALGQAGSVRARQGQRQTTSDWMEFERRRGIIGTVDPHSMREISDGLYVEGQLHLDDSEVAREAWRLLKHDAIGLSFGYMVSREHADNTDGVTVLDELDVFEITLTPAPANPDARVLSAKSAEPPEDEVERAELDQLSGKSSEPVRIASFEV